MPSILMKMEMNLKTGKDSWPLKNSESSMFVLQPYAKLKPPVVRYHFSLIRRRSWNSLTYGQCSLIKKDIKFYVQQFLINEIHHRDLKKQLDKQLKKVHRDLKKRPVTDVTPEE